MFRCEFASRMILPAIRRELVIEMSRSGLKKSEIARILGITPSAVTQYLRGKRAKEILTEKEKEKVREIATKGVTEERICELCKKVSERLRN